MMRSGFTYKKYVLAAIVGVLMVFWCGLSEAAPKGSPWGKDYFPNINLVDQNSVMHRFYDDLIKDKVVAINFIYTKCGDSCPAETASLRQVYRLLSERMGKDIFFYTISIDPEQDTPEALKHYADRFKTGPGWLFLTGKKDEIVLLRKKLGLYREDIEKNNLKEHNINFIIGNEATGRWMKKTPFDEPHGLAWLLSYSLPQVKIKPLGEHPSYKEAKELTALGKAEDIFRFRCQSCHALTAENGLGPGLLGVTHKRSRDWLVRWMKEPDKMLAEKDPVAVSLFEQFNKIQMPNLKLKDSDVEALLLLLQNNDRSSHIH
jgi:protein SCO1/2